MKLHLEKMVRTGLSNEAKISAIALLNQMLWPKQIVQKFVPHPVQQISRLLRFRVGESPFFVCHLITKRSPHSQTNQIPRPGRISTDDYNCAFLALREGGGIEMCVFNSSVL